MEWLLYLDLSWKPIFFVISSTNKSIFFFLPWCDLFFFFSLSELCEHPILSNQI